MFKCKELLEGITYECIKGTIDKEISEVVYDSRKIVKDCLFICICGYNTDGHSLRPKPFKRSGGAGSAKRCGSAKGQ